ncbi:MAG TPA: 30S ribosome-binding factor RbfA [Symbiobacteriaceae bacterium]
MSTQQRVARVAEQMRAELAELIRNMKDPRVGFVSVVQVQVSNDLRHAKVYVSVLGDDQAKKETMKALQGATGHLRSELAHLIRLRYVPELHFVLDESIEHGSRVAQLLAEVQREEARRKAEQQQQVGNEQEGQGE